LTLLCRRQEKFGLPHAGECDEGPCEVWVLQLGNQAPTTPQVLVSGALHGNEQVGAVVCIELAEMLLKGHETGEPWATRLLNTRGVVIIPTPNAVGYHNNQRGERSSWGNFDPNRDFGFDQMESICMQTVAAMSLSELYKEYLFQIAVTFHGGDNMIGFAWGDTKHCEGQSGTYEPCR